MCHYDCMKSTKKYIIFAYETTKAMIKDEYTLIQEIKAGSEESYRISYDKCVSLLEQWGCQ